MSKFMKVRQCKKNINDINPFRRFGYHCHPARAEVCTAKETSGRWDLSPWSAEYGCCSAPLSNNTSASYCFSCKSLHNTYRTRYTLLRSNHECVDEELVNFYLVQTNITMNSYIS